MTINIDITNPDWMKHLKDLEIETLKKAEEKERIYLKPGDKAPEGVKVERGSRGGKYYIAAKEKSESEGKPKPQEKLKDKQESEVILSDEEADNYLKALSTPNSDKMAFSWLDLESSKVGTELHTVAWNILKTKLGERNVSQLGSFYHRDKTSDKYGLAEETIYFQLYWAEKLGYDKDKVMTDMSKLETKDGEKIANYDESRIAHSMQERYTNLDVGSALEQSKLVINKLFDSKEITIYRGVSPKQTEGNSFKFKSIFPVSRWTLNPRVAETFAREKHGKILKTVITADRILAMDFVTGENCYSDESEVDIDHRGIQGEVFDVNDPEKVKELVAKAEKQPSVQIEQIDISNDHNWLSEIRQNKKEAEPKQKDVSMNINRERKSNTGLAEFSSYIEKSDKPLVPKTLHLVNKFGTHYDKVVMVDPDTGMRRLKVTHEGKPKQEQKFKDVSTAQEKLARQEREEETGAGKRAEYGPVEIPWTETHKVKVEDTPYGIKYTKKNKTVELKNTITGWAVYEDGKRVAHLANERDAHSKAKAVFLNRK